MNRELKRLAKQALSGKRGIAAALFILPLAVTVFISLLESLLGMYLMLFVIGAVTTATEWKNIRATTAQKLRAVFTFPLFMFTYIPVSFAALFMKVEWKPIHHTVTARELTHV